MGDSSLRFLAFLIEKGVWSYIDASTPFVQPAKVFHYKCMTNNDYYAAVARRQFGESDGLFMSSKLPRKKVIPPSWTSTQIHNISEKLNDTSVKYLAFPVLLETKDTKCSRARSIDAKKHMMYYVFNKKANILEVWDDTFGYIQSSFQWKELHIQVAKEMLLPVLNTFGISPSDVFFSNIPESKYGTLVSLLSTNGFPCDFGSVYKLFIVNYIGYRMKAKGSTQSGIVATNQCLKSSTLLKSFVEYNAFCASWLQTHASCKDITKVRNLETGHCVDAVGDKGLEVQDIQQPCSHDEVYNLQACVKLSEYFITKNTDLSKHVEKQNARNLISFIMHEHPHCVMMMPHKYTNNEFVWRWYKERRPHWILNPPSGLNPFLKKFLINDKVRFAVFLIHMVDKFEGAHANAVIVDKKLRTVERYEPNAPIFHNDLGNDERLDDAVAAVFQPIGFEFIPCMKACPIGFHRVEWAENTPNVKDFGGNCMVWALWYIHMRLMYPDIERTTLMKYALQELKKRGSLKHFINGFHAWLIKGARTLKTHKQPNKN